MDKYEWKDLMIGALGISLAITLATSHSLVEMPFTFILVFFIMAPAFILHELGHKWSAERFGLKSRFMMWEKGLLLSLILSVFKILLLFPGAVYIYGGYPSRRENGIISLAGPLVNIFLALLSIIAFYLTGVSLFLVSFRINIHLAFFNLIPIPPLDGSKVIAWNFWIWSAVFFPVAALDLLM